MPLRIEVYREYDEDWEEIAVIGPGREPNALITNNLDRQREIIKLICDANDQQSRIYTKLTTNRVTNKNLQILLLETRGWQLTKVLKPDGGYFSLEVLPDNHEDLKLLRARHTLS